MVTCYNQNFTNCATDKLPTATAATNNNAVPPFQKDIYTYVPNVSGPSLSEITYSNADQIAEDKEFDFGSTFPPGSNFVTDRKLSYGTAGCIASDVTTNSSGGTLANTTAVCDSYGHQTSVKQWISGSTYATTGHSYTSNGLLQTSTDPRNTLTTFTYGAGSCNGAFPTSVNVGGLTSAMTWDCNGEVQLTKTDANNMRL